MVAGQPRAQRAAAQQRPWRLRRGLGCGRRRCGSGWAVVRGADFDQMAIADVAMMSPRSSPQLRLFRNDLRAAMRRWRSPDRDEEQPRRNWSSGHGRDRSRPVHACRQGRIRIPVTAFEGGAGRAGRERTDRRHHDPVAKRTHAERNRRSGQPSGLHRRRECPGWR